jgi:Flp pilus assembly protein TadD
LKTILLVFVNALFAAATHAQGAQSAAPEDAALRVPALIERLRAKPSDVEALGEARGVGVELLRAARFEEAAKLFDAMRGAAPHERTTLYGGALAHFNLKHLVDAEEWARAAVSSTERDAGAGTLKPGDRSFGNASDIFVMLSVVLAVKGDNAGALAAVSRAVSLAPDNFDAQLTLGRALYGAGDLAAASRALRTAVALRPEDATARFYLATTLEGAGDDEAALAAYRELAAVRPDMAEGHLGVGVLLVKRGGDANPEGIRELEQALAINGNLYEGRVALGRALIRSGRAAESVEHLKRAAELAPKNPEPHYQLAVAYRRLGRKAEAEAESAIVRRLHEAHRGPASKSGEGAAAKPGQ